MFEFIKCPFCAGHDAVTDAAANIIGGLLTDYLEAEIAVAGSALETELYNIRNAIDNACERKAADAQPDPLLE